MAEQADRCYPTVLIHGDGNFNSQFQEDLKLTAVSSPVAVVSIFGVQSTGKSTLLNGLLSTDFRVMDASQGMHQTTRGIWGAKCPLTNCGHDILAIDTEGSDGSEREDDTKFEKQTALFVLAISNFVIINMKCDSVNLHHGGNQPLLRTAFEVMMRIIKTPRKVNLVFVLRDKNKCPLDKLEEQLKKGLHKIWKSVTKQSKVNAALEDYFNIKVVAMSNYEEKQQQFQEEVADLREWIISKSTSGEAAAGFVEYAKNIWDKIQKEKDLDLPSERILAHGECCNRISKEMYQSFCEDESWLQIKMDVESCAVVPEFGRKVDSLIDKYLSQYDDKTLHYDKTKRDEFGKLLIADILLVVQPTYIYLVEHMSRAILLNFEKAAIDELKRSGVLFSVDTQKFVNDFGDKLKDAAIKHANWNKATQQLTQLELEIARSREGVRAMNEQLVQENKNQREFWLKIASIGGDVLGTVVKETFQVLQPTASIGSVPKPKVTAAKIPKATVRKFNAMASILANLPEIIKRKEFVEFQAMEQKKKGS